MSASDLGPLPMKMRINPKPSKAAPQRRLSSFLRMAIDRASAKVHSRSVRARVVNTPATSAANGTLIGCRNIPGIDEAQASGTNIDHGIP